MADMTTQHTSQHFFSSLETSPDGLSQGEAEARLLIHGLNQLEIKKKEPLWITFFRQFTDLMVLVLIGAALVAIAGALIEDQTEELVDAYIILGVVFLNALIGFIQEFKAEKALEALKNLIAPKARVIREGAETLVEAKNLAPGDLLILSEGDKIGADALLFEANELKVEESALTGESVPSLKTVLMADTPPFPQEAEHTVYQGTSVVSGSGKAIVFATGKKTEFNKIAHMTVSTTKDKSPLQKELFNIGLFVGKVTLLISLSLFFIGVIFQGYSIIEALLFSVAVAVAAVPEGLPATITIALALGVQRLARKNAIVKQLSSVETLGSTTVICSDKTGTLTKNEMTVTEILLGASHAIRVEGIGYAPEGKMIFPETYHQGDFRKLISVAAVCNEASLVQNQGSWRILGDPTEGALLVMAKKGGFDLEKKLLNATRVFPFDSERKRMSVVAQNEIWVKGAPDSILELSTRIQSEGHVIPLTPSIKNEIASACQQMGHRALRVLAVAYREKLPEPLTNALEAERELIFLGLIGMIDPPRPEVGPAVQLCHKAGIRTIIITGDFGATAKAIAQKIHLADTNTPVITGEALNRTDKNELQRILQENQSLIFARVAPEHKKRIVEALKELGEIVAVTGDGVNDAPALKRADIGIAMGITGTDVSKEVANMILTDDSFATIVMAVEEGRHIYQNLRKFVWYIFSTNIGELTTIFLAIFLGLLSPLTAVLILIINLGTDVLPALALGVDSQEKETMNEPPRDPEARIMSRRFVAHFVILGIIMGAMVVGIYILDLMVQGWRWGEAIFPSDPRYRHASTMAFVTLVLIQIVNAFNARSPSRSLFTLKPNYYLWGASAISFVMLTSLVYVEWLRETVEIVTLTYTDWGIVMAVSFMILVVEEVRKWIVGKKNY
jgi:calcium-translocating P-type ATPase